MFCVTERCGVISVSCLEFSKYIWTQKTITSTTPFPGASSQKSHPTAAQTKDAAFALKKGPSLSATPNYQHSTNETNSYLLAAIETKHYYVAPKPLYVPPLIHLLYNLTHYVTPSVPYYIFIRGIFQYINIS